MFEYLSVIALASLVLYPDKKGSPDENKNKKDKKSRIFKIGM